jgi:hypothetical protein
MILLGASSLGGAMSVVFGAQFLDAVSDFEDGGQSDPDLRDRAIDMRLGANIAILAGAAFAGGGLALILTAPSAEPTPANPDGANEEGGPVEGHRRAPGSTWALGLSGQGLWLQGRW